MRKKKEKKEEFFNQNPPGDHVTTLKYLRGVLLLYIAVRDY